MFFTTFIYFTHLVGVLVGMIFQIFVWRSPKGCCYGNQLNMGDVCKRRTKQIYSLLRHSTTDWPIISPFSKGSMAIIRLHCAKFSELPSSNIGVYAVKTCNFCRDSPAIWRWSWFVTLAFPNGLEDRYFDFSGVIGNGRRSNTCFSESMDWSSPCRISGFVEGCKGLFIELFWFLRDVAMATN